MSGHLDATWALMAANDLDVLVLGREANARWVVGVDRLWLPGTRPWGPGCVVVRATESTAVLTTNDVGIPPTVPRERCYPLSWDPRRLYSSALRAAGVEDAGRVRRIGVDGTNPLATAMLSALAPQAHTVDASEPLRRARQHKSDDEIAAIAASARLATAAFARAADSAIGKRVGELAGRFYRALADEGVTTAAIHPRVHVGDGVLEATDVVPADRPAVLEAGVVRGGWEAHLARPLSAPFVASGNDELVAGLAVGAIVGDLRAQDGVEIDGLGLGYERLDDDDRLAPGMVVSMRTGTPQRWQRDVWAITATGPRALTA